MAICACALIVHPLAYSQEKDTFSSADLERVEKERDKLLKRLQKLEKKGLKTDRELQEIDDDLIRAAADSRRREEAAIKAQLQLKELEAREKEIRTELLKDEEALADILATLMTFGSRKPPALATSPDDIGDAIRAAILMGDIAPKLAEEAEALAAELDVLAEVQLTIQAERSEMERAEKTLLARQQEIEALAKEKRQRRLELAKATSELEKQNAILASQASSLQALLQSLENKAPIGPSIKPPPPKKFAKLKRQDLPKPSKKSGPGKVTTSFGTSAGVNRPVIGSLVSAFGTLKDVGGRTKGQTWQTRKSASVVAPKDGRVEYAGEFRSYGQMVILDLGNGYLVILAGMESIYAEVGQALLGGEPIGRMAKSSKTPPELYIEVRRNGSPIDPEALLNRST
jgi:septal ring factor EnvC (AmiA/AmiB activator)